MSSLRDVVAGGDDCAGPSSSSSAPRNPAAALADVLLRPAGARQDVGGVGAGPQLSVDAQRALAAARAAYPGATDAFHRQHAAALAAAAAPLPAAPGTLAAPGAGWAAEFGVHHHHHHAHAPPPPPGAWAAEFASRAVPPPPFPPSAAAWAAEYEARLAPGAAWATEYTEAAWGVGGGAAVAGPTPEQRKAARGPHPDDPLNDPAAPTWVAQFNATLGEATVNGGDGAASAAASAGLFGPAEANPATRAPDPAAAAAGALAAGRLCDAEAGFEAALRRAPGDAALWAGLGRARAALGDAHRALAALRLAAGACAPAPAPPSLLLDLADAALAAGGGPRAAAVATECVAQWAAAARAAPPAGTADAAALDAALAPLAVAGTGRGSRDAAMALGALRSARGAHVAAADAYAAAVASAPATDAVPLLALGRALLAAHRPDHAVAALTAATRRAPALPAAWRALARARAGDPLAAARAHARAATLAPGARGAWDSLAVCLMAAGREDWARAAEAGAVAPELLID